MPQILLIRHGQASFGAADYDQLSPLGEKQSQLLGAWWADCGEALDRFVSGNMRRHQQTAAACMDSYGTGGAGITAEPGFNEYDFQDVLLGYRPDFADGDVMRRLMGESGNPQRAFQQLFETAIARWMSGEHDDEYTESWPDFRRRCVAALQGLIDANGFRSTAVFTSGGPIAAIAQWVLGVTDRQMQNLNWVIANSAVTRLVFRPGQVSLSYFNNFSHLQGTGNARHITYR